MKEKDLPADEAQNIKDEILREFPELNQESTITRSPDPSSGHGFRPRKSRYGRVPNIRHFDRNNQNADRVKGQINRDGKMRYKK